MYDIVAYLNATLNIHMGKIQCERLKYGMARAKGYLIAPNSIRWRYIWSALWKTFIVLAWLTDIRECFESNIRH